MLKKGLIAVLGMLATGVYGQSQQGGVQRDFLSFQRSFRRVDEAFLKKEAELKAAFEAKGLVWPAKFMYIRSFKYDGRLEVWVKDKATEPYKPFKSYPVCALAGSLGPKRLEGDYQVPEGHYYINSFKPNSQYHLALGVNYPNASDRILSDKKRPGGEIYIHGSCVSVGCIPLTDPLIEELYVLAASTRAAGQDFIPLHVFPVRFKIDKSREALEDFLKKRPDYIPLATHLEKVYYYFEEKKQLPTIFINGRGDYIMLQEYTIPKRPDPPPPPPQPFKENTEPRKSGYKEAITDEELRSFVNSNATFPGGMDKFKQLIDAVGASLSEYMPEGKQRQYISVEFVVNRIGKIVNVQVDKAANNEMNNRIIEQFEKMPNWKPAMLKDKPVARRFTQTIVVNAPEKKPEPVQEVKKDEDDW
jgi:murein L,D-transpeptidase YafK